MFIAKLGPLASSIWSVLSDVFDFSILRQMKKHSLNLELLNILARSILFGWNKKDCW